MGCEPYAGVAWREMQFAQGLDRLGHDVYYLETTSTWPYDPVRRTRVGDSNYAVPYVRCVAESFGFAGRWGYRRSYGDKEWFGLSRAAAEDLLANADAVLSVGGSTRLAEEDLKAGDVGTVVERHVVPGIEDGYSVEFFDMTGRTVAVATIPQSQLRAPSHTDRPAVRVMAGGE